MANRPSGERGAAEGGRRIDNPTTMDDAELWAAMAVKPIDREAVKALRDAVTGRVGPKVHGALVLEGERNGRRVSVRLGGGESEVTVAAGAPAFEAKSRDGRVRAADGAPAAIANLLSEVPNSTRWKKVTVAGGPEGIEVTRKGGGQADWLCDLWLAERIAAA